MRQTIDEEKKLVKALEDLHQFGFKKFSTEYSSQLQFTNDASSSAKLS